VEANFSSLCFLCVNIDTLQVKYLHLEKNAMGSADNANEIYKMPHGSFLVDIPNEL
jgi:hypothetical protein